MIEVLADADNEGNITAINLKCSEHGWIEPSFEPFGTDLNSLVEVAKKHDSSEHRPMPVPPRTRA